MLSYTIESLNYTNFDIFIGTYPNDPATQEAVQSHAHQISASAESDLCESRANQ